MPRLQCKYNWIEGYICVPRAMQGMNNCPEIQKQ